MSFTQDVLESIKKCIADLEQFPEDVEKNDDIKKYLLEVQTQLTDCVVEMKNNFEIVDACYMYNKEEMKPQYIISMTEVMEKRLLDRIKDNPVFKTNNDLIKEDKSYPDTFRHHVAGALSTLIFNFINDDGVVKAEKDIDNSMKILDKIVNKMPEAPSCPEYISDSDFASIISNKNLSDAKIYKSEYDNINPIIRIGDGKCSINIDNDNTFPLKW